MELPAIKLPQIELPFDIPLLMHPPVDHFIIALPIIILLLEFINIFAKKRAIGVVSFFLLILTVVAAVAADLTGSVDGKEACPLLSEAAQGELKEHKLLGTYLMLASAVVLLFKILSAMIGRGLMKALYLLVLILFVAGILKQGKEGGELVYTYGANVKIVKTMDDKMFEIQEELDDYIAEEKEAEEEAAAEAAEAAASKEKEEAAPATTEVKETPAEAAPATVETPAETASENVKTEVKESVEAVEEKVEEVKVEVIPQEVEKPQIATH
jgi:uncharacterized membrane protein